MATVQNARIVAVRNLDGTLIGKPFSYKDNKGKELHARIAAFEPNGYRVDIFLDGVLVNGSTRILTLRPTDELLFISLQD
ncbi:hypothetical protein ABT185_07670 [Streptomyces clavifer]|uniref:hypothetical protein n=1 Tax=Streptomyces clavifer TaxID=68188 RepID=UPI00332E15C9